MKLHILLAALCTSMAPCVGHAQDACGSIVPASIGGPVLPESSDTAVLRWLGNANYEIAFGGQVYLLDTYYDRVAHSHPLGFTSKDVKRADVILISHAHFDHISDIAPVARQTRAKVVGAPISIDMAVKLGVPEQQTVTVRGGETLHFGALTVETALARHSTIQNGLVEAYRELNKVDGPPPTPEDVAHDNEVRSRGTFAPEVIDKGTLAFALVLRNGFKIVDFGSAGPITDGDRALATRIGRADVAIVAYQPHAVAEHQVAETLPLIQLFKPSLYLPAHHDHVFGVWVDLGLEPLFQILRDDMPETKFAAPLYRSAICVATAGTQRGSILSLRY